MAGLKTPEVGHDSRVIRTQTYLGHEALRQTHLPIWEGGLGLASSDAIKSAVQIGCQDFVMGRVVSTSARETHKDLGHRGREK